MKDSIIEAVKEANTKLQKKLKKFEARLFDLGKAPNKQEQPWNKWYTSRCEGWAVRAES